MTENEAIELIENDLKLHSKDLSSKYKNGLRMAINALEKQIPKRPDIEGDGYADGHLVYDTWICPCCGKYYEIDYDDYEYCPNCGQSIDRSELN